LTIPVGFGIARPMPPPTPDVEALEFFVSSNPRAIFLVRFASLIYLLFGLLVENYFSHRVSVLLADLFASDPVTRAMGADMDLINMYSVLNFLTHATVAFGLLGFLVPSRMMPPVYGSNFFYNLFALSTAFLVAVCVMLPLLY
jgi:hypothetical protein